MDNEDGPAFLARVREQSIEEGVPGVAFSASGSIGLRRRKAKSLLRSKFLASNVAQQDLLSFPLLRRTGGRRRRSFLHQCESSGSM